MIPGVVFFRKHTYYVKLEFSCLFVLLKVPLNSKFVIKCTQRDLWDTTLDFTHTTHRHRHTHRSPCACVRWISVSCVVCNSFIYGCTLIQIFGVSVISAIPTCVICVTCKNKVSRIWIGLGGIMPSVSSSSVQFCKTDIYLKLYSWKKNP